MAPRQHRVAVALGALIAATTLVVGGCASGAGSTGSADGPADLTEGMINIAEDVGEPVDGGTLTFGAFSEPLGLDPASTVPAVTTGGVEMINIYDSLMRFDAATQRDVPQLAESLEHNADHTEWTLRLRENVTFSDGSTLDAAAVQASQERFGQAAGPESGLWSSNVTAIDTPDDRTVVYRLAHTWPNFSHMLSSGAGMIVGPGADGADGEFTPIGAGPFEFRDWRAGDRMILTAREDYWDGAPPLDEVVIAYLATTQTAMESMVGGEIDMNYVRYPQDVELMLSEGLPGYINMTAAADAELLNAEPGRPGSDPRVRKALQLAIDTEQIADRAYGTAQMSGSALFGDYSRWRTEVQAPEQDIARARELVEQAKADGFDGTLVLVNGPEQSKQEQALALAAQLEVVGIELKTRSLGSTTDQIRAIAADQDYDLGSWGVNIREADPYLKMSAAMHSAGKQVYGTATSAEMDALIDQLQTAPDDDAALEIMAQIQELYYEDVPFLVLGYYPELLSWQQDIHGVQGTANSMVLLGNAWRE